MVKTLKKAVKWYCDVVSKFYVSEDSKTVSLKSRNSVLNEYCRYLSEANK